MRISVNYLLVILFIIFGASFAFSKFGEDGDQKNSKTYYDSLPQIVEAITINSTHSFAGEELPLENMDVKERLDRELLTNSYRHSSTIQYLKLMPRYFPLIESILKQEGVPDDFKYLAVAESGLRGVVSPAGAKGLWQFMKGTAKEYGLEVNHNIDERYHVEKSTRAACKYLKDLKERFGSWTLAAAAYNMGPSGLNEELENQKEAEYYDLNLNQETMRYIFRIVAIKAIHLDQQKYGYYLNDTDLYPPLDEIKLIKVEDHVESLADFAHEHGVTYRELKRYNPWLLQSRLQNVTKKVYFISLPKNPE